MQAVIMAGGKGSRLKELTADTPKALIKIGNRAMIDIMLEKISVTRIKKVTISVNHLADKIRNHVGCEKYGLEIDYVQEEKPLGTAGSLGLLNTNKDLFVTNCDIYTDLKIEDLVKFHKQHDVDMIVCSRWHSVKIPYGILQWSDDTGNFSGVEEKPCRRYMINAGMYTVKSSVLKEIPVNEYMDITTLMTNLVKSGSVVKTYPIMGTWYDIGDVEELNKVTKIELNGTN